MERFRIIENRNVVNKYNTLLECVDWLNKQELGLHNYYIECLKDDIEIHSDDVILSFKEGECPNDLQFF